VGPSDPGAVLHGADTSRAPAMKLRCRGVNVFIVPECHR
jgi:hypothetical protein